jgi:hypothetical protein
VNRNNKPAARRLQKITIPWRTIKREVEERPVLPVLCIAAAIEKQFSHQSGPNPASTGMFSSGNGRKIRHTAPRLSAKKSGNRSGIFSYAVFAPAASKNRRFLPVKL